MAHSSKTAKCPKVEKTRKIRKRGARVTHRLALVAMS
jgi:hypothetical protein